MGRRAKMSRFNRCLTNDSEERCVENYYYRYQLDDSITKVNKIYTLDKNKYNLFGKGLENENGILTDESAKNLIRWQKTKNWPVNFLDPLAGWSLTRTGYSTQQLSVGPFYSLCSEYMAKNLAELYSLSLERDLVLDPKNNLFCVPRNDTTQSSQSSALSKFLSNVEVVKTDTDYLTDRKSLLFVLGGGKIEINSQSVKTKIITGRNLAELTHLGFPDLYSLMGEVKIKSKLKYTPLIDYAEPDIKNLIAQAINNSYSSAWYNKFDIHLKPRPEYFGNLVDLQYPFNKELINNSILEKISKKQGNFLLSSCYPEGSPMTPAYPSVTAVLTGSIITILKYYFCDDRNEKGGCEETNYELNLLADNLCMSRMWAGVNDRHDLISGLFFGEAIGIRLLKENCKKYYVKIEKSIKKFNGECVCIE